MGMGRATSTRGPSGIASGSPSPCDSLPRPSMAPATGCPNRSLSGTDRSGEESKDLILDLAGRHLRTLLSPVDIHFGPHSDVIRDVDPRFDAEADAGNEDPL